MRSEPLFEEEADSIAKNKDCPQDRAVFIFKFSSVIIHLMKNKTIIFAAVIFVLAVGLGLLAGFYAVPKWTGFEKPYYGVLLENGDFYVGRLNRFPAFWRMTDILLLRVAADPANPEQTTFSLIPLEEGAIWSPESLLINPESIVFWGRIGRDSDVMRAIQNPVSQPPLSLPQEAPTAPLLPENN